MSATNGQSCGSSKKGEFQRESSSDLWRLLGYPLNEADMTDWFCLSGTTGSFNGDLLAQGKFSTKAYYSWEILPFSLGEAPVLVTFPLNPIRHMVLLGIPMFLRKIIGEDEQGGDQSNQPI
jgi:hypothetical protein